MRRVASTHRAVYKGIQGSFLIIMQRSTRRMSVIRMTNRRRGGHVDLRVAISVMKRFEFLFESVCSDVQVASDDVR